MQVAPPTAQSSIRIPFFYPGSTRPGSTRRSSLGFSSLWITALLLVVVHLAGCGVTYNTLPLTANPSSVAFGSVEVGKSQATTVTLQNQGLVAVTLSGMQAADPAFKLASGQMNTTIPAGGSATVQVTFTPTTAKSYSSQVVVLSGSKQTTFGVSGTGHQAPQNPTPPPASGSPKMQLSSTNLQFGSVPIGGNAQQTLTVTSTGTAPLEINALNATGSGFAAKAPSLPLTLQPNQSLKLPITFGPKTSGAATGSLVIGSNAANASSVTVNLAGDGTQTTPPPTGSDTPALTLSSTSVDFGSVAVGSQEAKSVTLTSTGTASVVIQSFAVNGSDFSTGKMQTPLTLAPGQQVALPITFVPSAAGAEQGQITLTDNATGSPTSISLAGTGTSTGTTSASLSVPQSVEFGDVTVGSSGSKTITLVSNGTAPVTINAVSVAGGQFSSPKQALPQVLQPNQQMSLKLKFSPTANGSATGSVTVTSNSATNASVKIPMHGKGVAATAPGLSASATSLSFGQVTVGSQASQSVTVTSTGTAPATITGGTVSGTGYSATYAGVPVANMSAVTLQPGQQVTFDVVFDPTKQGNAGGQLSLATDAGSAVVVSLSGKGMSSGSPALTLSSSALDFGDVQMDSKKALQLTLTSSGTAPVTISSSAVAGQGFQVSSVSYPSGISGWPATLSPGQQLVMSVTFSPDAVSSFSGNLALTSDASGGTQNVPLSGTGDAVPAAGLTVSPTSLSFGQVTVGSTGSQTLTMTSSGNAPLTITAINVAGAAFSGNIPSLPITLQPNATQKVAFTFTPTANGSASGTVTITSNDPAGPATVSLGGTGATATSPQLTVSPTSVGFGNVTLNTSASKTVTLTSSGTAAVTITAVNASGPGFTATVSGANLPLTLNPTQTATLQVQFDPSATGAASGQLTITSNAGSGSTLVPLSGTGTAATTPQLTVSPTTVSFGNVAVGSPATVPVTLTSSGTAPVTISADSLSGTGFSIASGSVTLPVTVPATQAVTLNLQFNPQAAGQATGQLTLTSNSSTGGTTVVQLSGTGTVTTPPTVPTLQISATSLPFGNVQVGSTSTLPLTLTSTGTAPVTINAAAITGTGFSDSGTTFPKTLNPNQSVTLNVQFDPTAAGSATGQLTISSNSSAGATVLVQLTGNGTATVPTLQVSATSLPFGNVQVGSTSTLQLTLTSTGTAPVNVNSAAITGTGFSDSGVTFPKTLNPNQSVTLNVQFDPTAAGSASGQLTISSNSSTGATVQVQLTGSGTAVQHEVDLSWDAPSSSSDPVVGYNIYRSSNGGSSFTKLNSSPESQVSYTDSTVQSGTSYVYEVKSVDGSGVESTPSNQITLSVP